jgi:hypothetical protein
MDAGPRVLYIFFVVISIVLACLKLWWLAALCLCAMGMVYLQIRMFDGGDDW